MTQRSSKKSSTRDGENRFTSVKLPRKMKKYNLLVLTDHAGHSAENSVYALVQGFHTANCCARIDVASRGIAPNHAFFYEFDAAKLYARPTDQHFGFDPSGQRFAAESQPVELSDYDFIFFRLPHPTSQAFLEWLPTAFAGKPIINDPTGILRTSTKAFLLNFPDLCAPIQLCRSVAEVLEFAAQFPIVLKPLREYGGKGILKIANGIVNDGDTDHPAATYLTQLTEELAEHGMLAMQFLKNVKDGDKRILVVDGQVMAASLRLPAPDSWLCNVARGGTSVPAEISSEEAEIIRQIAPKLKEAGILIFGADTLVGNDGKRVLSEINTMSIGGFPQAQVQTGQPVIANTVKKIIEYVDVYYRR